MSVMRMLYLISTSFFKKNLLNFFVFSNIIEILQSLIIKKIRSEETTVKTTKM